MHAGQRAHSRCRTLMQNQIQKHLDKWKHRRCYNNSQAWPPMQMDGHAWEIPFREHWGVGTVDGIVHRSQQLQAETRCQLTARRMGKQEGRCTESQRRLWGGGEWTEDETATRHWCHPCSSVKARGRGNYEDSHSAKVTERLILISHPSNVMALMLRVMLSRIKEKAEIVSGVQAEFRPKRSTIDQAFNNTILIYKFFAHH